MTVMTRQQGSMVVNGVCTSPRFQTENKNPDSKATL
jgi:hypothetical protein